MGNENRVNININLKPSVVRSEDDIEKVGNQVIFIRSKYNTNLLIGEVLEVYKQENKFEDSVYYIPKYNIKSLSGKIFNGIRHKEIVCQNSIIYETTYETKLVQSDSYLKL